MHSKNYDFVVIGGGIFGCYSALVLASRGSVLLVEREAMLLSQASFVNQARLHGGYHYPRARLTALSCVTHLERFVEDHGGAINAGFDHYYAIASFGSLVSARQFERSMDWISAPLSLADSVGGLSCDRVEQLYQVREYAFDASRLRDMYEQRLNAAGVDIALGSTVNSGRIVGDEWEVSFEQARQECKIHASQVVNATYANTNSILSAFGLVTFPLRYEVAEIALAYVPQMQHLGLTIMDGAFFSLMPFGLTGLHSLTSVPYTHQYTSEQIGGVFSCQQNSRGCRVFDLSSCRRCEASPHPQRLRMLRQARQYLPNLGDVVFHDSLFTQKVTPLFDRWSVNHFDERPSSGVYCHRNPDFMNILSGKVSGIYEVEAMLSGP
jgi:glycine/D-amino acid oxidase-like deaminating enzyme